ncbi:hypothetical protein BDL97_03G002800 [Sphagnum fallax]|nr:hypothetical protein BDL97_03G002800 [Sphagnum fallax]
MADFISHRHLGCSFFSRAAPRNVLVSSVENGPPEDHYISRIKSGETEPNIPCDSCKGRGWLLCDFCNGQKTNVQVRANRFYRRCPTCRAVGVLVCPQCKVFKCVTFADGTDAGLEL